MDKKGFWVFASLSFGNGGIPWEHRPYVLKYFAKYMNSWTGWIIQNPEVWIKCFQKQLEKIQVSGFEFDRAKEYGYWGKVWKWKTIFWVILWTNLWTNQRRTCIVWPWVKWPTRKDWRVCALQQATYRLSSTTTSLVRMVMMFTVQGERRSRQGGLGRQVVVQIHSTSTLQVHLYRGRRWRTYIPVHTDSVVYTSTVQIR